MLEGAHPPFHPLSDSSFVDTAHGTNAHAMLLELFGTPPTPTVKERRR